MDKFDVYGYFYESLLEFDDPTGQSLGGKAAAPQDPEEETQLPGVEQQEQQPQQPVEEPTPAEAGQKAEAVSTPFAELSGKTITGMSFEPSATGGAFVIEVGGSDVPVTLSWKGPKVFYRFNNVTPLT